MMVFEFANAQRTIHLDDVAPYPADAYMGHSAGHWEGDTLVVDVSSFTPYTWFDRSAISIATPCMLSSDTHRFREMRSSTKPRSKIPKYSRGLGKSAFRSTAGSNPMRSSWTSGVLKWSKKQFMVIYVSNNSSSTGKEEP